MSQHLEWSAPAIDAVAPIRQRILVALADHPARDDPAVTTALTELLANAAESHTGLHDPVVIAVHHTHLTVTNRSDGPVPAASIPPSDSNCGRGLAFVAALWPQTDWTTLNGLVTARMELT